MRLYSKVFWLGINLSLGLIPSLLFFFWIERNMALPILPKELQWPWVFLNTYSIPMIALFNAALFFLFGVLHSVLAQENARTLIGRVLPQPAIRSFYVAVTGLTLLLMMGLWQHTGLILWRLPLPTHLNHILSLVLFWGLLLGAGRTVIRIDALHFVGIRQLLGPARPTRTGGSPPLRTGGMYSRVRHPVYLFTLAAFLLTPLMSLDRMILFGASVLYLAVAIPIEERKLVSEFGKDYEEYRKRVPALLPRIFRKARNGRGRPRVTAS